MVIIQAGRLGKRGEGKCYLWNSTVVAEGLELWVKNLESPSALWLEVYSTTVLVWEMGASIL